MDKMCYYSLILWRSWTVCDCPTYQNTYATTHGKYNHLWTTNYKYNMLLLKKKVVFANEC